jgi:galactokinase
VHLEKLASRFREIFHEEPTLYRAPGRVNLIGEHTDYNDGFVFPAAIDLFTWIAIAPRDDRRVRVHSDNFDETAEFELEAERPEPKKWSTYISGVALACEQAGYQLRGANLLVRGDVPIGAGVSSSAALEVAAGFALLANSGVTIDGRKLAQLCQKAENDFVGTRCGIMDQLASACCVKDRALLLDCRSLEFRTLPLPSDIRLVICNSMVKRELASSAYNARRAECEEGVRILAQRFPAVRALRDASMDQLRSLKAALPEDVYRRCRHVITEDARVIRSADALEHNRLEDLGQAMAESHRSLRDDYEVSCGELDLLVELANQARGVHGARMTGAGFGGSTINLVDSNAVEDFRSQVSAEYKRRTGVQPDVYVSNAADGVKRAE